jgi:hypothetical protein
MLLKKGGGALAAKKPQVFFLCRFCGAVLPDPKDHVAARMQH